MLILNWILILASYLKLHPNYAAKGVKYRSFTYPSGAYFVITLILFFISGALLHRNQRIGLGLSVGLIILVFVASWLVARRKTDSRR
jgi:L-asparagine transporter-like permease